MRAATAASRVPDAPRLRDALVEELPRAVVRDVQLEVVRYLDTLSDGPPARTTPDAGPEPD